MKTLNSIPTGKIERAGQLVKTGLKVGTNYIAYYGEKLVNPSLTKDKLHESNAEDIYDGLKNLKGSALKVAQWIFSNFTFLLHFLKQRRLIHIFSNHIRDQYHRN